MPEFSLRVVTSSQFHSPTNWTVLAVPLQVNSVRPLEESIAGLSADAGIIGNNMTMMNKTAIDS